MRIDVDYDLERAAASMRRWDAAFQISMADRPPVCWGACQRLMLARRGKTFCDLFDDPIDQLVQLVTNWKWVAENLPGDHVTEPSVIVQPQFENASNANAFGSPIVWFDHQPPQAGPAIHTIEQLENFTPPPVEDTLWGRMIDYYHAMRRHLDDGGLELTIRGEPIRIDLQAHIGGESPFMVATDLCGHHIYEWMHEAPEALHRMLSIITERMIATERMMREMCGLPLQGSVFMADDTAQIISLDAFREFVVPYTGAVYESLGGEGSGRPMHMCGRHTHLYPALIEDLKCTGLWGYGALNTPEEVRDGVGGKMWLVGNIDPLLLCNGPVEQIAHETRRLLNALLPCGGVIVCDGFNLVPETPISNLQVVMDVVEAECGARDN
jgi:hypothetical protein